MSGRRKKSDDEESAGSGSPPIWPEESEAISNFRKKQDELEAFVEKMKEVKYEREDVQRKTFGKWINSMLAKGGHPLVKDLFTDLRDGTKLLSLLEVLTNKTYKRERGKMRVHHLNNVSRALQVLQEHNVRLVNISNNEIVDGNAKITLALAWSVFLHWQVNDIMKHLMAVTHQSNLEKALLTWCQTNTKPYPGVDVKNFSTSWSDGLAFAALIHRWRPDIIDFANLASKSDPTERLEAVFRIAHEILGIERLLDAEDVNTAVPDKKSVMMYVMCLFQALAHSGLDPPPLPSTQDLEEEIKNEVAKAEAEKDVPPSIELSSYQNIVEEVLSWLLIADDRISSMHSISGDLNQVKGQFQEHEKFMLSLTEHQSDVGDVLGEGSRLLQEAKIHPNEMEEVKVHMKLLNTKWEELRLKAMDRQNKIHEKLMSLQVEELEGLKEFLTSTEDRISRMGTPPIHDPVALEENLKEQTDLHADILKQQERVVAFSNLVVVVDENNPDNDFSTMEDQLGALSERWTHICAWTEKRGKLLRRVQAEMPNYVNRHKHLEEWLVGQEKRLKEVEANPGDATQDSLMRRYDKLQLLQGEMEEKMKEIGELESGVAALLVDDEASPDAPPPKFLEQIEALQDRWAALSQIMEAQSQRMSKYSPTARASADSKPDKPMVDVEMVDILSMARAPPPEDFPRAKRTKLMNEWEVSSSEAKEWLTRTKRMIESSPGSATTTFDELSVDEQLILCEDLEAEQESNQAIYEQALRDSASLIKQLNQEGGDPSPIEAEVAELSEGWARVKEILDKRRNTIDFLLAKKTLETEINRLGAILGGYEKWLEGQGEVNPISGQGRKLLDQCRVKVKTIGSHEGRLTALQSRAAEVLPMTSEAESSDSAPVQSELSNLSTRWENTVRKLQARLQELESLNRMSTEEKTTESVHQIKGWIQGTEGYLATLNPAGEIKLMDLKIMRVEQQKLKGFLLEGKGHEESLEVMGEEELKGNYEALRQGLEEREKALDTMITSFETWDLEMHSLESWLEEVDVFVCAETPAIGDISRLDAQLEQSNGLADDLLNLAPKFLTLTTRGKELVSTAHDSIVQPLRTRLLKLTNHWNDTALKSAEQNALLRDAAEKTKGVVKGVGETGEWLNQLGKDVPSSLNIASPPDLARLARKFTALKDRVDKREASFRALNEKGNELLLLHQTLCKEEGQGRGGAIAELARNFTTLNARWTEVTGGVDRKWARLKDASLMYGEFRSKAAQANDWLDRLERKLKKKPNSAADVEELSEDLDDIEQYVGGGGEEKLSQIHEIGRGLVEDGILVPAIQSELSQLSARWNTLHQQALTRRTELEGEVTAAEEWERMVTGSSEWLEVTHRILTTRLEQELSAEDLPADTQELGEELAAQEKVLREMEHQVGVLRKANKMEAAARLEEQKDMLQKRLGEVQSKFATFSSPPPESKIYGKMERIWRSLRQVEQALCFLELASEDPESIQGQLNHCTKEYGTLSELKRDVESVLREGRRQVEEKRAEPKLSAELDSVKALYNKLGMQVANTRNALEKGLGLSTQMQEELGSLELWLEESDTGLQGQFGSSGPEMDFIRSRTEELPRWRKVLEEFNANYDGFLKLVDPVLLDSLKERRALVLSKWENVSSGLVKRHEEHLKSVSIPQLEDKHKGVVGELEEWLAKAEGFLNKLNSEPITFKEEEILELQSLNDDLSERSDGLDTLRDETIDLVVAKGDPFSLNNPENLTLARLTTRLESIGNQLHALSSCILLDEDDDDATTGGSSLTSTSLAHAPSSTSFPTAGGFTNFAFDEEDEEESESGGGALSPTTTYPAQCMPILEEELELDVEVNLPPPKGVAPPLALSYSVENVEEMSVTLKSPGSKVTEEEPEATTPTPPLEEEPSVASTTDASTSTVREASAPTAQDTKGEMDTVRVKEEPKSRKMTWTGMVDGGGDGVFVAEGVAAVARMNAMAATLDALEGEEPMKKMDGMEQELHAVEPFVALTISKGDSLVFTLSKTDIRRAEQLRSALDILRSDWLLLKARAERGRIAGLRELSGSLPQWAEPKRKGAEPHKSKKREEPPVIAQKIEAELQRNAASEPDQRKEEPMNTKKEAEPKGTEPNDADAVRHLNKLRESIATLSRALGNGEDAFNVKEELDKINPAIQNAEGGATTHSVQSQRVLSKLLEEWATLNLTVGGILLASPPPSKSPSPAPSATSPKGVGSAHAHADITELEDWLAETEAELEAWRRAGGGADELKLIQTRISRQHRTVMLVMAKGSRLSPAYDDGSAGGSAGKRIDGVGYRWRNLLAEMTMARDRLGGGGAHRIDRRWWEPDVVLRDWIARAREELRAEPRIADEAGLRDRLSALKSLEHEMGGKGAELERLRGSRTHAPTEAEMAELKQTIEQLMVEVPERRKSVEIRLMNVRKLSSQLDTTTSWVLEVRAQVATAKHRPLSERSAAIESIMIRVEDKDADVLEVVRNYINMEKEAQGLGQTMTPQMMEKVRQLKEDWLYVKSRGEINILTPASDKKFFPPCTVAGDEENEGRRGAGRGILSPKPLLSSPSPGGAPSPGLGQGTTSLVSAPNSAFQPQQPHVLLTQVDELGAEMTLNLKALKQQVVVVGDVDDIRSVLDKQKIVLRELELKKPQLDELMQTAENLKSESTRHNLHVKVSKLREHWTETNEAVVRRKGGLEQCLADSVHWEAQSKDVEGWLHHMETHPPPHDHTDHQAHTYQTEVQAYSKHIENLQLFAQRLTTSYVGDDLFKVKSTTDSILRRYSALLSTAMSGHGGGLRGRIGSQHSMDRGLEAELSWVGERERMLDGLEAELGPHGHPGRTNSNHRPPTLQRIRELEAELEKRPPPAYGHAISARGDARVDEVSHRIQSLKQRSFAIRSRLENSGEHASALLLSIREIIEWVIRKDTELVGMGPLAGDTLALQRQIDEHRGFRRTLETKRPVIESNLISGRQHVANEPVGGGEEDGDRRDGRDTTRTIRREVNKLSETWLTLLARSDNWQMTLEEGIQRLRSFQQMLDDGSARLATAEAIKSRWPSIAAAADKSTLLDQLKTFREHISSTQRAVTEINEAKGELLGGGVCLSTPNLSRVDDLNVRLRNLQLNAKERESELSGNVASVMAVIPPTSHAALDPPWEKAHTPSKVPYYINHDNESTQWDHPQMTHLLNGLGMYNEVRFSAYRTALKLRALQKEIHLDRLGLKGVVDTFDSLGLRGHNDRLLDVPDMSSTLSTLYSTHGSTEPGIIPLLTDLAVNWLLNVYDSQRTGQLRNLSFKIGIVLLAKGPMEDKFRYLFRLVADAQKEVDERKLGLLLHDCMQIPRQLGEVAAFGGSNIEPSVRSCFEKGPREKTGIGVGQFLEWVKQEPQSLVWLPVLHRIAAAEGARHQAKCNVCKVVPILGLRYRCLKCFNFDMCQRCFFNGRKGKTHKLTHPMQEYCTESTSGEDVRDFTRALKNRFKSKRSLQKHRKLGYLPVQTVLEGDMLESPAPSPQHSLSPDVHSRLPDSYPARLLQDSRARTNSTPDSEDEHSLIAQYCQSLTRGDSVIPQSPIQIVAAIDAEESEQLEAVIRALEEENANLAAEYERLRSKSNGAGLISASAPLAAQPMGDEPGRNGRSYLIDSNENNILAEARLLRQHKGRLEARMQILEEHNRQLETQLGRLRSLLDEPKPNSPSRTGTLQSKSVVAAELATDSPLPHRANGHSNSGGHWRGDERGEEARPPPPPTPSYTPGAGSGENH